MGVDFFFFRQNYFHLWSAYATIRENPVFHTVGLLTWKNVDFCRHLDADEPRGQMQKPGRLNFFFTSVLQILCIQNNILSMLYNKYTNPYIENINMHTKMRSTRQKQKHVLFIVVDLNLGEGEIPRAAALIASVEQQPSSTPSRSHAPSSLPPPSTTEKLFLHAPKSDFTYCQQLHAPKDLQKLDFHMQITYTGHTRK